MPATKVVQCADDVRALPPDAGQPAGEADRVERHERHDEDQEQHVGEGAEEPGEQCGHQRGDVGEVDLIESCVELVRAHSERAEPGPEIVDQGGEAVLVGGKNRRQLGDGQRQRCRETEDHGDQGDQGDGHRQPLWCPAAAEDPGQRVHADDEDERENDRSDDRGELPQRQNADQEPGHGEHDDQPTRHHPARFGGSV